MFIIFLLFIIIIILIFNNYILLYDINIMKNNYISNENISNNIDYITFTIFKSKKNNIDLKKYLINLQNNYKDSLFILYNDNNKLYDKFNQSTLININSLDK